MKGEILGVEIVGGGPRRGRHIGVSGAVDHYAGLDDAACAVWQNHDHAVDLITSVAFAGNVCALNEGAEPAVPARTGEFAPVPFRLGRIEDDTFGRPSIVDLAREASLEAVVVTADAGVDRGSAHRIKVLQREDAAVLPRGGDRRRRTGGSGTRYQHIHLAENRKIRT